MRLLVARPAVQRCVAADDAGASDGCFAAERSVVRTPEFSGRARMTRLALHVTVLFLACWHTASAQTTPSIPELMVRNAKTRAEAEAVLAKWNAHLDRSTRLVDRGDYRGAMAALDRALGLVKRFNIDEEGGTYLSAYRLAEKLPEAKKSDTLLSFLSDTDLPNTRHAIANYVMTYLDLDTAATERLLRLSEKGQAEALSRLLKERSSGAPGK